MKKIKTHLKFLLENDYTMKYNSPIETFQLIWSALFGKRVRKP